jgi:hypothetical protein
MRIAIVFAVFGASAVAVGHACGVPWRDAVVVLLVATAVLLGPESRRKEP